MEKHFDVANTHVPDKVYSYLIQVRHMHLNLILCGLKDVVSMELFEDGGIERYDLKRNAQQIKCSLSKNNPMADRDGNMWKTFYNWIYTLKNDNSEYSFEYVVVSKKEHKIGGILNSFDEANNDEEINIAIKNAKKDVFLPMEENEKKTTYYRYLKDIFNDENKKYLHAVIKNFKISNYGDEYDEILKKNFKDQGIDEVYYEQIYNSIFGWLIENVNNQLKLNKAVEIRKKDYLTTLNYYNRAYNREKILNSVGKKIEEDIKSIEIQKDSNYLKQLNLIDVAFDEKMDAINNFLKAQIDLAFWSEKGEILGDSEECYAESLISEWKSLKNIVNLEHSEKDEKIRGVLIYNKCKTPNIKLQNAEVPHYFNLGYYQNLSNDLVIGWHPDYSKKLRSEISE